MIEESEGPLLTQDGVVTIIATIMVAIVTNKVSNGIREGPRIGNGGDSGKIGSHG